MQNSGGTINNSGNMIIDILDNYVNGIFNSQGTITINYILGNLDGTITNTGTIENHGTISNGGNNGGTIDNHSHINNSGIINNYNTITNNPFPIKHPSTIITDDVITNSGTINIESTSLFSNHADAVLSNTGTINNNGQLDSTAGTINNSGSINNYQTSVIINAYDSTLSVFGTITNNAEGTIDNYGTIRGIPNTGGGLIDNLGTITNHPSGTISQVSGTISNSGTILNSGTLSPGGEGANIDNLGTITNSGTINIESTSLFSNHAGVMLSNTGTINNNGQLDNSGGTIDNSGTLTNNDLITNSGTITNSGIFNNCGGTINNSGTLSGNPINSCNIAITVIQQGSAFVQQSTIGVNVTVSGSSAPDGTNISVTSIDYGNTQPPGTGALSIQLVGFYDVKISGISDGTSLVCISNPNITAQTNIMQYWYGGIWNDASNPTVSGNIICGSIPVNALNGTPIAIGKKSQDDTDPALLGSIIAPLDPIQVNTQFTASDTFTDDTDDTHTASWNWGDSTTSTGTVTESGGSGSVQNTHTYTTPGVYTITLTVSNSDGITSTTQFQYLVAYDPNGGFVTGSGWINSPTGAYTANPALTGKATFGFNSKYQNGATVPSGNTEFNFKVANLNFHSTSYDWLVVAGAKAQYKGTGTINGAGSYHFILTAIDGEINGGGGIDKFRMKITGSNGGLVYDNLLNAPDSSDPTTVLGGGDIVIHKS
ncbi:MAG: hypothetical protein AUH84_04195 [Thaumarchaeota archaeon 13_1_40CM_4_38_7]|nr:MAG: hypothetical protein AUH84_04195 [Thaumarchaeota archaeon 13_1_40CM_4_38_7]